MAVHVPSSTIHFIPTSPHILRNHPSSSNRSIRPMNRSFLLPASKRRRLGAGPAGSTPSRPGFIDQKLIEGSQQPRSSSSIPRESSPPVQSLPALHEEESQLDAFGKPLALKHGMICSCRSDLELLAQEDEMGILHAERTAITQKTPRQDLYLTYAEDQNAPQLRSRFFDRKSRGPFLCRGHSSLILMYISKPKCHPSARAPFQPS